MSTYMEKIPTDYIGRVAEFHKNFNQPINNFEDDIDVNVRRLRIKLLFEELHELAVASNVEGTFQKICGDVCSKSVVPDGNNVDKVEEMDALCDLQYVLSGGILSLGHQDKFDECFIDVDQSNMSKMCDNLDQVRETIDFYKQSGVDSYSASKGDKWIVIRKEDQKILKNVHYTKANIKGILYGK